MGKVSSFFEEQKKGMTDIYRRYLMTLVLSIVYAIYLIIRMDHPGTFDTDEHGNVILILSILGCFFAETLLQSKKLRGEESRGNRYVWGVSFFLAAVVFDILGNVISDMGGRIVLHYFEMVVACYSVGLFSLAIYRIIRDSKLDFHEFLPRVLFGELKVWGALVVIFLATALIISIFDALIFEIDFWQGIARLEIFLAGAVYLPLSISVIVNTEEENAKFTKGLILYALMPCVVVAMGIVYLYVLKILVTLSLPSNEVFQICATIFSCGLPVWIMAKGFLPKTSEQEEAQMSAPVRFYRKLVTNMRYVFAPLILLEFICMAIRIAGYGWTVERYMGMCFVLLQVIYTLWKPEYYEKLILVFLGIFVAGTLIPGIDALSVEYFSQKARFEKVIGEVENGTASGETACSAQSIYYAMLGNLYGEAYMKSHYTEREMEMLRADFYELQDRDDSFENEYQRWDAISYSENESGVVAIPVSGYRTVYPASFYESHSYSAASFPSYDDVDLKFDAGEWKHVDLTGCVEYFRRGEFEDYEESQNREPYRLSLDGTHELYITRFRASVSKNYNSKEYQSMSIEGYILEK